MRCVELAHFGLDGLQLRERPTPRPQGRQVLVRVHANSINFRDLRVAQGQYDPRMKLPIIPLSDGAGEVAEVGGDVTRFRVGDRVAAIFMQRWIGGEIEASDAQSALGGAIDGMLSEFVLLDEDGAVPIPSHLSYEAAATLPCAAVTAWHALIYAGRVRPGETVLVQGTGGVSLFALQFAKLAGARVIATSSSDTKLARARELGADDVINYRTTPDWSRQAKELTGGRGVDHVIEVGGAGTFGQSLRAVRPGGHIAMIGILAGVSADIPTALILQKSIQVHGIYVGSREMFLSMNRAIEAHHLEPVMDRVFGMEEIAGALRYMESAAHFGKIVIRQS